MEKQERMGSLRVKRRVYNTLTGFGNFEVIIHEQNKKPFQVCIVPEKADDFVKSVTIAIGNLISLILRQGVAMEEIIQQLEGIQDGSPVINESELVLSIPDAVARIMARYQRERAGSRV